MYYVWELLYSLFASRSLFLIFRLTSKIFSRSSKLSFRHQVEDRTKQCKHAGVDADGAKALPSTAKARAAKAVRAARVAARVAVSAPPQRSS